MTDSSFSNEPTQTARSLLWIDGWWISERREWPRRPKGAVGFYSQQAPSRRVSPTSSRVVSDAWGDKAEAISEPKAYPPYNEGPKSTIVQAASADVATQQKACEI